MAIKIFDVVKLEQQVPLSAIDAARRLLHLEIVNWGLPKEQLYEWHMSKTWFPTLRWHREIVTLANFIPDEFRQGQICEPQILLHFPDEAESYDIQPHLDKEPAWANGRKYTSIVGVALSDNTEANGGFREYHHFEHGWQITPHELSTGDMLIFNPNVYHAGGLNHTGDIRYMVYFRYLEGSDDHKYN